MNSVSLAWLHSLQEHLHFNFDEQPHFAHTANFNVIFIYIV
jgi:hypothetical protein